MVKTLTAALLVLVLALAPATALAAWSAPLALPHGERSLTFATGAVDDQGRAALTFNVDLEARLGILTPGGGLTATVLTDTTRPSLLRFARDGTVVGAGTSQTFETPDGPDVHDTGCCERPFVLRWRPGTATAAVTPIDPARHRNYDVADLTVDRAGTAYVAAVEQSGAIEYALGTFVARVPAGGAPVQRALAADTNQLLFGPAQRASGAVLAWRAPRSERVLALGGAGSPLARGPAAAVPAPPSSEELLALAGPGGHAVHAYRGATDLWVAVDGGRPRTVAPLHGDDRWTMAAGADGTVAFASSAGHRLRLRTLDPHGHLRAPQDLGTWTDYNGPVVAVDGRGHAHVVWQTAPTTILVRDAHGRHTITTHEPATLRQLAVSPRGATLLLYTDGELPFAALATP